MKTIIKAQNLARHFGNVQAVKDVSFSVPQGRCVGLLGPNGAGKTTTMRMIMGLTAPTSGSLDVFESDASKLNRDLRAKVGLVPQEDNLDPDLSVSENLHIYGRYFGLSKEYLATRVPELLGFMRLTDKADARVVMLSGGMKRRLVIARALIADPDLVILDEPTTGLDPQARLLIWQQLTALKRQGKTLLLTTHYMDEAQRLCDDIVIVDGGKVLDEGTPKDLIARHVPPHVFELQKPVDAKIIKQNNTSEDLGDSMLFFTEKPQAITKILKTDTPYLHRPANLEDVFLTLTGRSLREK
tara:strand:+ start:170145 stop:171041 length:897 start_codon:yes stop_codon:yes gene_type:complete